MSVLHHAMRTSPMGEPFVGRCALCGAEGLKPDDVLKPCPNPFGRTQDQSLLMAVAADPDKFGAMLCCCKGCGEEVSIEYAEGELDWRCPACKRINKAPLPRLA